MKRLSPAAESLLAGVTVLVLHWLLRLDVAPGAFQDDAIYLGLGKALADGEGWRSIYAAGSPVHLKYPPALPALYAIAWTVAGTIERTVSLVHLVHLATAGVAGGLGWWLARVRLGLRPGIAAVALMPLALVSLVDHFQLAIAEGPFVAAWLAALAFALAPLSTRRAITLGLLLALATLLRSQGWALLLGVLAGLLIAGRDRRLVAIAAATALLPIVAWWGTHAALVAAGPRSTQPDEAGYLLWIGDVTSGQVFVTLTRAVWHNLQAYWSIIPRELSPAGPGHVVGLAIAALALVGARQGGRRLLPLSMSVAASFGLIMLWPFSQARFVLALLPATFLLVGLGWAQVAPRVPRRAAWALGLVALALVAVRQVSIRQSAHAADAIAAVGFQPIGRTITANTAWLRTVAPWVEANTPPNARIFTEGAAGLWLATGRQGVAALPATPNGGADAIPAPGPYLAGRLVADSITHVVASSFPVNSAVAWVEQECEGSFERGERIGSVAAAFSVRRETVGCWAEIR